MGSHLSRPVTLKESSTGGGNHRWAFSCMQGWRNHMEDAHLAISELFEGEQDTRGRSAGLFAVFDGHGGPEVAAYCNKHMPDVLRRRLLENEGNLLDKEVCAQALTKAFNDMDDRLRTADREELNSLKAGGSSPSRPVVSALQSSIQKDLAEAKHKGAVSKDEAAEVMMKMTLLRRLEASPPCGSAESAGCTAVCVLLTEDLLVCANAGDSRAVICREGKALALSNDHKPNDPAERSRIEAAGATVQENVVDGRVYSRINGNLNLSRAIGDLDYKRRTDLPAAQQVVSSTPEILSVVRSPTDEFLFLACDGIWDVKSNQDVVDFVRVRLGAGQALDRILEDLLDDCITHDPKATAGLGADNMTSVLVLLESGVS